MSELNPNHPATKEMSDLWHKMVAILMMKMGENAVTVTSNDVHRLTNKFKDEQPCVVFYSSGDEITLRLLSESEAIKLSARINARDNSKPSSQN